MAIDKKLNELEKDFFWQHIFNDVECVGSWQSREGKGEIYRKPNGTYWREVDYSYLVKIESITGLLDALYRG
jgi:hypothetical protein